MEQTFCLDCKKLVTPHVESENYGADADGNRGEERFDFTCPECGGDDLTEERTNCDGCSEPMETGQDYCPVCQEEERKALEEYVNSRIAKGVDVELIDLVAVERLDK